jgi:hypothetical protein
MLEPAIALPEPRVGAPAHIFDTGHDRDDALKLLARVESHEDALLALYADMLDDLERTRIATENRVRSLRQVKGMEGTKQEERLQAMVDDLSALERGATLELKRALRQHRLGPWVKRTVGVGEKQGARLLASVGDPYVRAPRYEDDVEIEPSRPRTVSELWAYCGYAPGQKRQKGVKSNWNAKAKMRAYLIAESCMKQMHSPYRAVYDAARAQYLERDTTDGHKHNMALRRVAKEILKDLWIEARD